MKYNHEFTQLGKLIFEATHEYISTTTLKRMWGYINDRKSEPRITTLNLLANVAGFGSYEQFEQTEGISSNQDFVVRFSFLMGATSLNWKKGKSWLLRGSPTVAVAFATSKGIALK